MTQNFNIANFLNNAPAGLILYSRFLSQSLEFNKVILHEFSEHEGPQRIIECVKYDDAGNLTDEKVYFDAYGRIKQCFFGNIIDTIVDLMPDEINGWDNAGICALITESYMCIGKVLMDRIDPDDDTEFPWIVGKTAMWDFDDELDKTWESIRFHKFDFSNVRFASVWETKGFFNTIHKCGFDFKDGTPIRNGESIEPECRNADKEEFFNALSDLCDAWKGTIPDPDFQEVLFKFNTKVILPELKKAFGWDSENIMNKD